MAGSLASKVTAGDSLLPAGRRRRSPAKGIEAARRKAWGEEWGKAGRDAGLSARKED